MSTVFNETTRLQDLDITEFDYRYCREAAQLASGAASASYPAGVLLEGAGPYTVSADDTGTPTAILARHVKHVNGTASDIVILKRGPAVVTDERLINGDDAAISAAQKAALAALSPPIIVKDASDQKIVGQPPIGQANAIVAG